MVPWRGDAAEIVYASGTVEPRTWAKVAPVTRDRIVDQCDCEGSRVAHGDVLARLDDSQVRATLSGEPKPLLVIAEVNEEDIPRVEVGQRAILRADAFPGQNLEAVVDSITPKGDSVTKTYRVRLRLPDDTPLKIGMSTDVNIVIRVSRNALLIPSSAIEGNWVALVEGGRAWWREIRTGLHGTNGVEALSGITDGARVVATYAALNDGARVTIAAAPKE